jgi:hypothetical protein
MHLVDKAMDCRLDLALFFYVAPFLKQAKTIAWARLKSRVEPLRRYGMVDVLEGELAVVFKHNGATIRMAGADNPDAMRGVRLDGTVIDEVAQVKPEVWREIIQPALADRKGWALFIGTPKGVNMFSELFYRAQELPEWFSARYTVYDTDALDPEEVERLRRDMTEEAFAREMLCSFEAAGDDQLISLNDVDAATQRTYRPNEIEHAPRIIGIDPARFGDDRSVIARRQGLVALPPRIYRGLDNMSLAGRAAAMIEEWEPDAVFCDAGAGSGVIDRLRQLGHKVVEVNFGGSPIDPVYLNKRAEIWFLMRDWLKAGGSLPNMVELRQDLATPTYEFTDANKIKLESKDKIKERGLPSPDIGDALALTFSQPVAKKKYGLEKQLNSQKRQPLRHDPYANLNARR